MPVSILAGLGRPCHFCRPEIGFYTTTPNHLRPEAADRLGLIIPQEQLNVNSDTARSV